MAKTPIQDIEHVSQIFKVLSDVTRLKIVLAIKEGEKNVTAIAQEVDMEQSAVSHQLKLLRDNRVVKTKRQGKAILYSVDDAHILDILEQTFRHVQHR
ncbi:metalloregulator ArsR/SmtB family transcription factor [Tetragenococcus koreensis]|uniref:ArsR family transcriptional regulator n=1 Tax=Tetragenococcus koreensis TaxID=290335 RepID=A0AAN4UB61_9ENTE|nr:metalloregulator ArsR/SmtB family transcription factor [Tetragenococcus koreensis]AYW45335.1 transcriptional regulator [Tetragenococcus koreensis]MCF1584709.1 metalloregulator ArsR/SmtB family transcription factor [Tetragenococcus koreensis]MCF1614325.1 metalloregulator ArsR/SmtB family transcription factor [Tetragenococcus koreensis]MCF1620063.1 metalloregulator ArsR/SmtB family transcription factor [Tetragenococcus koreensis]MCF1624103.1 metalloregulator ArsR/SmtB family transcription fac